MKRHKKKQRSRCWQNIFLINHQGQAIFEFIAFLPVMILLYYLLITVSSAINGSINQQKVVRGYFFQLNRYNSMSSDINDLLTFAGGGIKYAGMDMIGWTTMEDTGQTTTPLAACYEMKLFAGEAPEKCNDRSSPTTNFIKPTTVFGLCSTSYRLLAPGIFARDHFETGNPHSGCRLTSAP
ncbi:MAG: hypothetical protein A2504_10715 [Bdellovibrionales bacterium RIFOXYD12_FULL_39_22]|nr:MAG: hypothetical protein A2385_14350 [Bdellovibrionales bacterium RIFOXYB1_FULL_39_21]OFZ40414.1 MAG: hypothetical protein A2485_03040 [Bdellovibrionales bacterium RIFOXYC12_FULL_39_17]OFZ49663.1 MAG: hypothetical protein A2404_09500 [Bdellovibrionales bacterium RIFOXYC1_FULL_39_130]OFZ73177.1 MAG: hypothetical protein A2451_16795 [Bdellovibrionales bacterium RIFOXYC2_FULL_39_8]OFZ77333.1 MAG: hypothetical protein A2560_06165 [Bdellovibrionales bacterium RIFOXYD1_FULL_39_84]OFZ95988.1 MAG: